MIYFMLKTIGIFIIYVLMVALKRETNIYQYVGVIM